MITFSSSVLITENFTTMKNFYTSVLKQEITLDFTTCVTFKDGFTIWQLGADYPIAKKLGYTYSTSGNKNLELCFETEYFDEGVQALDAYRVTYLHHIEEECWGQKTVRFYDPDNNLVELGESIPCFVSRMYDEGMSVEAVVAKTGISEEMVRGILDM